MASAASASSREREARPSASCWNNSWASRNSAGPPNVRIGELERRVVARMRDRELVADRDPDQRQHDQRQGPGAPQPDSAGVLRRLGHLDADPFGALEVAPPEGDGPREADRQCAQALELERLADKSVARGQHRLAQGDDEEQPEALDEMPARDLGVPKVDAPATAGKPVQGRHTDVGGRHREPPEGEARVAVGERAGDPQGAGDQLPDEVVDEVLALGPPAQSDDQERRPPDLKEQVAGDEQPRAVVERVADRDRHEQAGEHQPDQQRSHRQAVGLEPVRPPRGHVPGVDDRERQDDRLRARAQIDVLEQVVDSSPIAKT